MIPKDKIWPRAKRILLIGTGGGNDIAAALLPMLYLDEEHNIPADIAGILNPACIHSFNGKDEDVINSLKGYIKRGHAFRCEEPKYDIKFIDTVLPQLVELSRMKCNFYEFSIRYGTTKLVDEVKRFINRMEYDAVIGVDIGGDILARGRQDPNIITPVMDMTTLYLLSQLDVPSYVLVLGMGVDSEIRRDGMNEIHTELEKSGALIDLGHICRFDNIPLLRFKKFHDNRKREYEGEMGGKSSHTLDTAMDTIFDPDRVSQPIEDYVKFWTDSKKPLRVKLYDVGYNGIVLDDEYFGMTMLFDAKKLAEQRRNTAFPYENPLEQYVKLKHISPKWNTELDIPACLMSGDNWTSTDTKSRDDNHCMMLLAPTTLMKQPMREELLSYGIRSMLEDNCDLALILKQDFESVKTRVNVYEKAGMFYVISTKKEMKSAAKEIADYVSSTK